MNTNKQLAGSQDQAGGDFSQEDQNGEVISKEHDSELFWGKSSLPVISEKSRGLGCLLCYLLKNSRYFDRETIRAEGPKMFSVFIRTEGAIWGV